MKNIFVIGFILFFLGACSEDSHVYQMVEEWDGKEILFPENVSFSVGEVASVDNPLLRTTPYKIVHYTDSMGCMSCKLRLNDWALFVADLQAEFQEMVPVYMFFCPKKGSGEIISLIESSGYKSPVCIDAGDSLNKLNHFPSDMAFRTFLLDKDNKVLAIGNPVLNPKVKDLYLRIIRGESPQAPSDAGTPVTTVSVSSAEANLGTFPWQEPRTCTFTLRNTGDRPLVIHDVTTSCGCLTVDYPEEPARPGEELTLRAHYRADSRGTVLKSMQVYCNAQGSPLRLRVTGTAE